ncbi:MAG TPA: penicillin-binding protein 2 [Rhodanobacteraceae bacterium]|nr:penicillin-binding protein 2 [Rhodanobacteraceae bacterium]
MSARGKSSPIDTPGRRRGPSTRARLGLVAVLLALASAGLVARAVDLQVLDKGFYQAQGNERFLRTVPIAVSRGTIFDRNGVPLAVSTPVESLWANPAKLLDHTDRIPELAKALGVNANELARRLSQRAGRQFVYLQRQMSPEAAKAVLDLDIPGVNEQREYRRYYPSGTIAAHVIGFTNIDGHGLAGIELAYNDWLTGTAGAKKVIRDGNGRTVENVELVRPAQPGHDLTLSIDRRIQYLAWRELKQAMQTYRATSASMVVMDPRSGEVLAMVNLPSYNPNDLDSSTAAERRNRTVTDVFEPGSTAKAFTVTAALLSGKWTPTTPVQTAPGWLVLSGYTIHDDENIGLTNVTGVITRSSNIGAAKIALSLPTAEMYDTFRDFGFGSSTGSGFPGESAGILPIGRDWRPIRQATIGYGYGFSVTLLQLARAYSALADGGVIHHPSFIDGQDSPGKRVVPPAIAHQMVKILTTVVENPQGTAYGSARIAHYSVAGKTGTSHQADGGGYSKDTYNSVFAGMAPASHPRLVAVVVVRGPQGKYFGTAVAAPVFKAVMSGALRLLDIPPDKVNTELVIGPTAAGAGALAMDAGGHGKGGRGP